MLGWSRSNTVLFILIVYAFALCERKSIDRRKEKYLAAAGENQIVVITT